MKLKEVLSSCKSELKASQSRFKDVLLLQPTANEIDDMMNEIKDDLEDIEKNSFSDAEIDDMLTSLVEEHKSFVACEMCRSRDARHRSLMVKLANVYLIMRNKQMYSAFRRVDDAVPPPDESEMIVQAIRVLDDLLTEENQRNAIDSTNIAMLLEAIENLFWYPKVNYQNVTNAVEAKGKKCDKYTRVDDDAITAYVLAEHLSSIFIAFPYIHPESKKTIINDFLDSQAKKLEINDIDEFVESIKKSYFCDELGSVHSSIISSQDDHSFSSFSLSGDEDGDESYKTYSFSDSSLGDSSYGKYSSCGDVIVGVASQIENKQDSQVQHVGKDNKLDMNHSMVLDPLPSTAFARSSSDSLSSNFDDTPERKRPRVELEDDADDKHSLN